MTEIEMITFVSIADFTTLYQCLFKLLTIIVMQFTYGQTGMAGKRWIVSGRSLPGLQASQPSGENGCQMRQQDFLLPMTCTPRDDKRKIIEGNHRPCLAFFLPP